MRKTLNVLKKMAEAIQLNKSRRHILLTGQPGVGKTTLVKKVCDKLEDENWQCQGFYTEEKREDGQRVGFDVVTFDDKRGPLARIIDRDNPVAGRSYMVGRYNVLLQSFEQLALPSLAIKPSEYTRVIVIDEIGKMELFSRSFTQTVKDILKHPKTTVFATVPLKANPFVEEIKNRDDVQLYTVTKENRNQLVNEVIDAIKESLECYGT
ncbi:cancer-related nucleoside-triphosphatase-like [Ruditapes philippinarum]|uniref:cancer-related nucleoside-triphosphatase-like n=1 Tax=Ruditapes philippinarum TaxID=129788 RepID=UPI00295BEB5A|nr:cancer-related nucleoside-triphosphatase-like [Ruditapes philippinarum]XP_060592817.1 cancer-related nucleoside-triphosphatase-like [Ruditapes philippinarum]